MMSDPPPPSAPGGRQRSCLRSVLTLLVIAVASAVLLLPPAWPVGPLIVLGGGAFAGLMSLHYFVWGRWLGRELEEPGASDKDPPP